MLRRVICFNCNLYPHCAMTRLSSIRKTMKLGPSLLIALAISSPSFSYAQTTCPATLKWTDATDVERTTAKKGRVWKAKVENYTNASVAHLDVEANKRRSSPYCPAIQAIPSA